MKKLITVTLLTFSTCSLAETGSLTIDRTPDPMGMFSIGGNTRSIHSVRISQIPFPKLMKITSINWKTTNFPDYSSETVSICYYPEPTTVEDCYPILPNSIGTTQNFTSKQFGHTSYIVIRHKSEVGKYLGRPASSNSVTFNYEY